MDWEQDKFVGRGLQARRTCRAIADAQVLPTQVVLSKECARNPVILAAHVGCSVEAAKKFIEENLLDTDT